MDDSFLREQTRRTPELTDRRHGAADGDTAFGRRSVAPDSNCSSDQPPSISRRSIAPCRSNAGVTSWKICVAMPTGFVGGSIRNSYAESSRFNPSSHTSISSSRQKVQRMTRVGRLDVGACDVPFTAVSQVALTRT